MLIIHEHHSWNTPEYHQKDKNIIIQVIFENLLHESIES